MIDDDYTERAERERQDYYASLKDRFSELEAEAQRRSDPSGPGVAVAVSALRRSALRMIAKSPGANIGAADMLELLDEIERLEARAGYFARWMERNRDRWHATEKHLDEWRAQAIALQDWMQANVPEMECRGDEDCDHCVGLAILDRY